MIDDLTARVRERFGSTDALTSSVRFDIDEGCITIEPEKGEGAVHNEEVDTDCIIKLSTDDFAKMLDGNLNATTAFMMGKLKVVGDMGVAMKLSQIM
ncbi:MAG: SCP2 sterol-binding domain-containing protein [Pseudomonadota bacterium]